MDKLEINVAKLISEIYRRPMLWDKQHKSYNNRIVTEKAWKDLGTKMKLNKDQLKKKWKSLRDQFRNETKKILILKSRNRNITEKQVKACITWPHYKSLFFLKDQMKTQNSIQNWNIVNKRSTQEISNEATENLVEIKNSKEEVLNFQTEEEPVPKELKTEIDSAPEIMFSEQQKFELQEMQSIGLQNERDDDEAFFYSLLPYLKTMDKKRKLLCRMGIQRTVYEYAFPNS